MIGPGVVGHWIAPGERDVPDPDEYLKVGARSVRPLNGSSASVSSSRWRKPFTSTRYSFWPSTTRRLRSESQRALRQQSAVPRISRHRHRDARPPAGAWDDHGRNVLPLSRNAIANTSPISSPCHLPVSPNFTGWNSNLGDWDRRKPLRLIIDGYTDYFTATSMYAADQAGIKVIAPYVEAQDAQGNWKRVMEDMGFPAGLERTMVADLTGKIPARHAPHPHRQQSENLLGRHPDRSNTRYAGRPRRGSSARQSVAGISGLPTAKQRLKPASDTTYSYTRRSKTGPYARAAGTTRVTVTSTICCALPTIAS